MNQEALDILKELSRDAGNDDFVYLAEHKLKRLAEIDERGESIEYLLCLLESHPTADFGAPGPIVHFLETFYQKGYEEELIRSIRRNPTPHTLWMLNRIINGSKGEQKQSYLNELDRVAKRQDVAEATKISAAEFLNLHL